LGLGYLSLALKSTSQSRWAGVVRTETSAERADDHATDVGCPSHPSEHHAVVS
jgi:hypothetical protein